MGSNRPVGPGKVVHARACKRARGWRPGGFVTLAPPTPMSSAVHLHDYGLNCNAQRQSKSGVAFEGAYA